jgi:hypothetical protein
LKGGQLDVQAALVADCWYQVEHAAQVAPILRPPALEVAAGVTPDSGHHLRATGDHPEIPAEHRHVYPLSETPQAWRLADDGHIREMSSRPRF